MKRLWQAVLETMKNGIRENDIFLDVADTSSPYGEATVKNAYSPYGSSEVRIAVNPYYSYEAVFSGLLSPGCIPELERFLCDLLLHHLWEMDSYSGMDRAAFYVRFLEEDIANGAFGTAVSIDVFSAKELRSIAFYYFRLCRTGCYEKCFCGILSLLHRNAWVNAREDGSLIIIMNCPFTFLNEKRLETLQNIFLQAGRERRVYWEIPPAIIECEDTVIGNCLLF